MDIKNELEHFVKEFNPSEYVLGGGLAVALQTGRERETKDIDIIALGDIALHIYHYTIDHGQVRIDVCDLNYVRSIKFTPELLSSNTEQKNFRSYEVPCLSREALVVSKLTSLYSPSSPSERRIQPLNAPLRRFKDLTDFHHLYASGINDDKVRELLTAVPHLAGTDLHSFYEVAQRLMTDKTFPREIVQNVFTIAKLGTLCPPRNRERFFKATKRVFAGREAGTIGLLADQLYHRCLQNSNRYEIENQIAEERS